jgi:hypothetical protein
VDRKNVECCYEPSVESEAAPHQAWQVLYRPRSERAPVKTFGLRKKRTEKSMQENMGRPFLTIGFEICYLEALVPDYVNGSKLVRLLMLRDL